MLNARCIFLNIIKVLMKMVYLYFEMISVHAKQHTIITIFVVIIFLMYWGFFKLSNVYKYGHLFE